MHRLYFSESELKKRLLKNLEMSVTNPVLPYLNFLKLRGKFGLVNPQGSSWFSETPRALVLLLFQATRLEVVLESFLYAGLGEIKYLIIPFRISSLKLSGRLLIGIINPLSSRSINSLWMSAFIEGVNFAILAFHSLDTML